MSGGLGGLGLMAFTDCVGPGARSMEGLGWLARVGASTPEPLELVMGWSDRVARDHVTRLARAGLVERVAMRRGAGSLIVATSAGVREAGYPATRALRSIAPTSWAHACGCGWVSAWLHLRLVTRWAAETRAGLAWWSERDIASDGFWRREVRHKEHQRGTVKVSHRPDLGLRFGARPVPVEVELKRKSRARLRGILAMYCELSEEGAPFGGVMYVTANADITENLRRAAGDVGLREPLISFRALPEVIEQTRAAAEQRAAHQGCPENGEPR